MRELTSLTDVIAAAGGDPVVVWAAQGMRGNVRAWMDGSAVAVASPALSRRDRLALFGEPTEVCPLVRNVLAEVGPTFRPLGDAELVLALPTMVPELVVAGEFGWMETRSAPPAGTDLTGRPRWLAAGATTDAEIQSLLDEASPSSYARPDLPGVRRWAGMRTANGRLVSIAADAWSTPRVGALGATAGTGPGVGLIAGVATAPDARGNGYGGSVCAMVVEDLVAEHGMAALMVDTWNVAAIRMYQRLGLRWRSLAAARVSSQPATASATTQAAAGQAAAMVGSPRLVAPMVAAASTTSPHSSAR